MTNQRYLLFCEDEIHFGEDIKMCSSLILRVGWDRRNNGCKVGTTYHNEIDVRQKDLQLTNTWNHTFQCVFELFTSVRKLVMKVRQIGPFF